MTALTEHGQTVQNDLSQRYGVSPEAVRSMMEAVLRGGGSQAQFDIPELGGMGQWSWGGMTMVGDMFNTNLQALVSNLCGDISAASAQGPLFKQAEPRRGSWQGQMQGLGQPRGQSQSQSQGSGGMGFGLGMGSGWWPAELGQPSSQGSQNDLSYAIFPDKRRLAINLAGEVSVYDTGQHEIGGISQQQSGGASWTFTSQFGTVDLSRMKRVAIEDPEEAHADNAAQDNHAPAPASPEQPSLAVPAPAPPAPEHAPKPAPTPSGSGVLARTSDEIFSALEKLGSLRDIGILSEAEFEAKKAELLARL